MNFQKGLQYQKIGRLDGSDTNWILNIKGGCDQ